MAWHRDVRRPGSCTRVAGSFSLVATAAAFIGFAAGAAEPAVLTERDAIARALARPAFQAAEQGRTQVAESAVTEAATWPNPVLAMEHERVSLPAGSSTELSTRVFQSFDLSGRRGLRKQAAGTRLQATRQDARQRRLEIIGEVRGSFSEALYRWRVREAYGEWLRRIEAAADIVAKLAKAGEASGYDRRRLQREATAARARLAGAQADEARARESLAGIIDQPVALIGALGGELVPPPVPDLEALRGVLTERPDLASLEAQAQAFDQERLAYERAWIPDLTLGVGAKHVDEQGATDTGLILGFALPLPLFERGQAGRQRAQAQAQMLRAESALSLTRAEAELRGAWRQADALHRAADDFRGQTLVDSRELTRIAEAAYRGGEAGVLELLDAYRADLDAHTTALDLALRARRARIELDMIAGRDSHD